MRLSRAQSLQVEAIVALTSWWRMIVSENRCHFAAAATFPQTVSAIKRPGRKPVPDHALTRSFPVKR